ncbi:MAG TPA: VOC family protein [Stellaceae bacterium]|nr:VOC family protein [Stellaceae bacterium]
MGELRHIAMSVPDPWLTAAFYQSVFGLEVVGETDSSLAEGVFLSDGVFGLALLNFKTDYSAQGKGRDFVGLHHFGIWVDDVNETHRRIERAGGRWLMGEPDFRHNAAYEVKFHDVNGVILDLVHNGWAGAQRRPGQADNEICAPRGLVPRFAERRAQADAAMAARNIGRDPQRKGQIRHLAMAVPDPWATAEFYKTIFGFTVVGETDSSLAEGVFLSDGMFGLALLDYKTEEAAQGKGKDFVGLHHFGIWVDDVNETHRMIERAGGEWLMGEPDFRHNAAYEVKFHDINGEILDLVHNGWAGTQRFPGQAENQVCAPRGLVPRFAPRREAAARTHADFVGA